MSNFASTKQDRGSSGEDLFEVPAAGAAEIRAAIAAAKAAFTTWRSVPAPVRGALVKRFAPRTENAVVSTPCSQLAARRERTGR